MISRSTRRVNGKLSPARVWRIKDDTYWTLPRIYTSGTTRRPSTSKCPNLHLMQQIHSGFSSALSIEEKQWRISAVQTSSSWPGLWSYIKFFRMMMLARLPSTSTVIEFLQPVSKVTVLSVKISRCRTSKTNSYTNKLGINGKPKQLTSRNSEIIRGPLKWIVSLKEFVRGSVGELADEFNAHPTGCASHRRRLCNGYCSPSQARLFTLQARIRACSVTRRFARGTNSCLQCSEG